MDNSVRIKHSYVILGASRGLGLGFVRELRKNPDNMIFALVRNPDDASDLHDLINENANKNIHVAQADLDNLKSLENAAKFVSSMTGGTLDIFVCNAAKVVHERGLLTLENYPQGEVIENDMTEMFKTNAIGVMHAINSFLPLVRAGNTKKIFVLTSGLGSPKYVIENAHPYAVPYSISKAAVNLIVAKFAVTFKDVIFVAVNPGPVKTQQHHPEAVQNILYDKITAQLRIANPSYAGPKTIEESVKTHLILFAKASIAESGRHLHADGRDGDEYEV